MGLRLTRNISRSKVLSTTGNRNSLALPPGFGIHKLKNYISSPLRKEIQLLAQRNADFRQLSDDYELLLRSLEVTKPDAEGDRVELIRLKTSLEAEALEMLSQVSVRR